MRLITTLICGRSLSHSPRGNSELVVARAERVMFLTVWIPLSAMFALCCPGGTYWMIMSLREHMRVNAIEVSLSSLSHLVVIPLAA